MMNKEYNRIMETPEQISARMRKQKSKKTKAEVLLAKALWHEGLRYRLNLKTLPGSPDIVITKYQIVIFVDGEFWHGKDFEKTSKNIKRNREYWIPKIERNMKRDRENDLKLKQHGWIVLHFWSREVESDVRHCVEEVLEFVEVQKNGMTK